MHIFCRRWQAWIAGLVLLVALAGCAGQPKPEAQKPETKPAAEPSPKERKYPEKPVEVLVPTNPGGGWDITGRTAAAVLNQEGIVPVAMPVTNMAGAGGYVGFTHLVEQHKGDPYIIMATSSVKLVNAKVNKWKYLPWKDATPLARLYVDWESIFVKKDSRLSSIKDLVESLKKDPKSVVIAGATPPDVDFLFLVMLLKKAGINFKDIKYVGYHGGGEIVTAVMGGHADVGVACVGEAIPQARAGSIKLVGVASEKRLAEPLQDTPTLKEQGFDIVFGNWRGFYGPPEMPGYARDYWREALRKMVTTNAWKDALKRFQWTDWFLADGFDSFLQEESSRIDQALAEAGILEKK